MTSRLPPWLRTVRVRLALTYSGLLFGITALLLAGVYLALSSTIDAAPLDPVDAAEEDGEWGPAR